MLIIGVMPTPPQDDAVLFGTGEREAADRPPGLDLVADHHQIVDVARDGTSRLTSHRQLDMLVFGRGR